MSNLNWSKVDRLVTTAMAAGLTSLGTDIKNRAIILAPKDSGDLRQSARVDTKGSSAVYVSFNTPYAKLRHYVNNLHPSTRLYLNNSLKSTRNVSNYFKEVF